MRTIFIALTLLSTATYAGHFTHGFVKGTATGNEEFTDFSTLKFEANLNAQKKCAPHPSRRISEFTLRETLDHAGMKLTVTADYGCGEYISDY